MRVKIKKDMQEEKCNKIEEDNKNKNDSNNNLFLKEEIEIYTYNRVDEQKKEKECNDNKELEINDKKKKINDNKKEDMDKQNTTQNDEKKDEDSVFFKRIINVEITSNIKNFIELFLLNREDILNWCSKNNSIYSYKINEKIWNIIFSDSKNTLENFLKEKSINIDMLSVLVYIYNLYCTNNNKDKINFQDIMNSSCITYRGIYENIDENSKTFKNLLREEREYKRIVGNTNNQANDFFSNYKKSYPYGINLIIGIFLTFLGGYYGSLILGYTKFTTRLICGILFSYVTLILEVIIYIIINEKIENVKKNQKKMGSNYELYERVHIKDDNEDKIEEKIMENVELIEETNKPSTVKQRKKT
ncbi:conserved Plasmodium protein, unknown function [Plasmodium sp. DRC-Itaito]|nr:conserved Plasmodium protein, unknown function [Plasmodium sp. DRC-Itaito]